MGRINVGRWIMGGLAAGVIVNISETVLNMVVLKKPWEDAMKAMGSLEFSKLLLREAKVAVSPGIGFGEGGDHFVRFALIENEHRTRQAIRGFRRVLGGAFTPSVPRASAG